MSRWNNFPIVLPVPLGYVRFVPLDEHGHEYAVGLLSYKAEDLDDPDGAAEAIMAAETRRLSLEIRSEIQTTPATDPRFRDHQTRVWMVVNGGQRIGPFYKSREDACRAVTKLSLLDWMVMEDKS